jgi:hypothetical protein
LAMMKLAFTTERRLAVGFGFQWIRNPPHAFWISSRLSRLQTGAPKIKPA